MISFGQVYQVVNLKTQKNHEGKEDTYIYYQSYFEDAPSRSLTGSIPVSSLDKTNRRKPISKEELQSLIDELKTSDPANADLKNTDAVFKQNDIHEAANLTKALWQDKCDVETTFSPNKADSLDTALKYLSQEIALVMDITPENAVKKITEYLTN